MRADFGDLVSRVFDNPAGRLLLKEMQTRYADRLKGDDTHDTYYRLGARDVIRDIQFHVSQREDEVTPV